MRVNGLYGWVRRNDARALVFLAGFAALSQIMAALVLMGPLAYVDPFHSLLGSPTGYALRYAPLVLLAATGYFLFEMSRDVSMVRRDAPFRFVDTREEPRLCGIVETLAISLGLPAPYVGVMETSALNAFACGARRRDATLVFTCGLIEALDDDELEAVVAHELIHVRNGDTRTIAAANVFMRVLDAQSRLNALRPKRYRQIAALLFLPVLFPIFLGVALVSQALVRLGMASRLMISSSREFVADAEAARLTQHPAALVSALRKIEGRSALPSLPLACEAMMIDGVAVGGLATHPTLGARIQALVAMTGSLALDERLRRDTRVWRPDEAVAAPVPALRGQMRDLFKVAATAEAPRQSLWQAFARVGADGQMSLFGLRWDMATALLATFGAALLLNHGDMLGYFSRVTFALKARSSDAQWIIQRATDCRNDEAAMIAGVKSNSDACRLDGDVAAHAKGLGINLLNDGRVLNDVQMEMLSPIELEQASLQPGDGTFSSQPPAARNRPATDLKPSYPLALHEAWDRLAHGDLTRYLESQHCGVLIDVRLETQQDRSVTWHVTSSGEERVRFVATLSAQGADATAVSLVVQDLQPGVPVYDSRYPSDPPYRHVPRPALGTPLRPAFAEAASAMLEDRLFRIENVSMGPPRSGLDVYSGESCSNQRFEFERSGTPLNIHDKEALR